MKKVLFAINTLGCAGAETALIELLKSLNDHYCKESVLSKQGKQAMIKTVWRTFWKNGDTFGKFSYIIRTFPVMRSTGKIQPDPESIVEAVISLAEDKEKRIRLGNAAKEKDIVHKGERKLLLELMQ